MAALDGIAPATATILTRRKHMPCCQRSVD